MMHAPAVVEGRVLRPEKLIVKAFYDTYGWVRGASGRYNDTTDFDDARPVLAAYARKTNRRIEARLGAGGRLFLDAGSGAVPHDDVLAHSAGFARRVCLDLSRAALKEARARVGAHGVYVQADVTSLPFAADTFDAIACTHVLYHVPADEQPAALAELYRVLAPGGTCVVVYASPRSPVSDLAERLAAFGRRRARRAGARERAPSDASAKRKRPPLYFHASPLERLTGSLPPECSVEVSTWRSVDARFTRAVVRDGLLGRLLMSVVYAAETLVPRIASIAGGYPMLVLRKPDGRGSSERERAVLDASTHSPAAPGQLVRPRDA